MENTLKQELAMHFGEQRADVGDEEVDNVLAILEGYNDNLDGLGKTDYQLLLRMVDDNELHEALQELEPQELDDIFSRNPFKK